MQKSDLWLRELKAAGWIEVRQYAWLRPDGALFRGPYGAWCALMAEPNVRPDKAAVAKVLAMFKHKRTYQRSPETESPSSDLRVLPSVEPPRSE